MFVLQTLNNLTTPFPHLTFPSAVKLEKLLLSTSVRNKEFYGTKSPQTSSFLPFLFPAKTTQPP